MKKVDVIDLLDLSFVTGIPTPTLFEMLTSSQLFGALLKSMMLFEDVLK